MNEGRDLIKKAIQINPDAHLGREEYQLKFKIGRHLIDARHVFTHIEWQMKVYEATLAKGEDLSRKLDFKWVSRDELEKLAIPTAFHQIKRAL